MEVVSANIGESRTLQYNGRLVTTGIFKFPVDRPIQLEKNDVKDDHVVDRRYHGGIDKACYLYSADHYDHWKKIYPEVEMPWGLFGENITIAGLEEGEISIGDTFRLGTALVQVTQPRQPCFKLKFRIPDKNIETRFIELGCPGIYLRVLEEGEVKTGDLMEYTTKTKSLSVRKIFELLYTRSFDPLIKKAINDPLLAESCKNDLIKRWRDQL